jgi:hypothetical protein
VIVCGVVEPEYVLEPARPHMLRASRLTVVERRLTDVEAVQLKLTRGQEIRSAVAGELRERTARRRARVRDAFVMLGSLGGMTLFIEAIFKVVG